MLAERDPANLPWKDLGVDIVIESTGLFTERRRGEHMKAGAQKVVISRPGQGDDLTIVLGVNDDLYDPAAHNVISNASCTTNCVAPMAQGPERRVRHRAGPHDHVHAYTSDQMLPTVPHKDLRRARPAPSTSSRRAPARRGHRSGPARSWRASSTACRCGCRSRPARSPTWTSTSRVRCRSADVNTAFERRRMPVGSAGKLVYTEDPIVSSDIVGSPAIRSL